MFPIISTYYFAHPYLETSKEKSGSVRIQGWDLSTMWIVVNGNTSKSTTNIKILLFGSN